jgi:predicted nucleic acid-binding protein
VADFLDDLDKIDIVVDADCGNYIFTDVHRLAVAHRLTSYDAAYLELALRRNLPLATLDGDLRLACRTAGVQIL